MKITNGVSLGEVIILYGENKKMTRDFLINLWAAAKVKSLYISYHSSNRKIIRCTNAFLVKPLKYFLNSSKFITIFNEFNMSALLQEICNKKPILCFIEAFKLNDNFENNISQLKEYAKEMKIAFIIQINSSEIQPNIISNKIFNKIWYLEKNNILLKQKFKPYFTKVPIWWRKNYHLIIEDIDAIEKQQNIIKQQKQEQRDKQKREWYAKYGESFDILLFAGYTPQKAIKLVTSKGFKIEKYVSTSDLNKYHFFEQKIKDTIDSRISSYDEYICRKIYH